MSVHDPDHPPAAHDPRRLVDPRWDAFERLGGRYEVRVLEPSPPAVADAPWFADDPVARGEDPDGRQLVSPIPGGGDVTWDELAAEDPELAEWCADRWLGAYRRLGPPPPRLVETRLALHALAEHVISPARARANGKIGLRYTRRGFGTPFFGPDLQARVEATSLVVSAAMRLPDREPLWHVRHAPITTLAAAARHLRGETTPEDAERDAELDPAPLAVEAEASAFIGDWYGFAASVLEELRAGAGKGTDPSRVQMWPEHFDLAVELGSEAGGARAAYGLSPGDETHDEPYAYVAPWSAPPPGELWQATGFTGAELPYPEILAAPDQRAAVLSFLRARLEALTR